MSSSPPFSHNSTTSRPPIHTAATVIPTLQSTLSSSNSQRNRAHTGLTLPSPGPDIRRRSDTTRRPIRPPPLDLGLSSLSLDPKSSQRLENPRQAPRDRPSDPIPIPPRPKERSPPTTPLTARARSPVSYFGFQHSPHARPHISASLTPYYTTGTRRNLSTSSNQPDPIVQRGFPAMGPRPGSPLHQYTPSSPLSPKLSAQSTSSIDHQSDRRPPRNMTIAGLPKFHPANFPSRDAIPSSRNSRPTHSYARPGRGSDAQQKLQQYQRDVIASATQSSRSILPENPGCKPSPPRLTPLRSPVDPMTPLALEGGDDYMLARSRSMSPGVKNGDGRELVERLVRRENERRNHPEARSGSVSPGLSPVLSPALSPA